MENAISFAQSSRGPRAYKSRRERPCDLCRTRKVACRIDLAPPCNFCYSQGSDCTFETIPPVRKRALPIENVLDSPSKRQVHVVECEGNGRTFSLSLERRPELSHRPREHVASEARMPVRGDDVLSIGGDPRSSTSSPNSISPSESATSPSEHTPRRVSALASYDGMSARIVGDAHPLKHFLWDHNDECSVSHVTYRRMSTKCPASDRNSSVTQAPQSVAFIVGEENFGRTGEPRTDSEIFDGAERDVESMFTDDHKARLVKLFFHYIYPYFPILSQSWFITSGTPLIARIRSLPLSLKSALYATSLPFILYDDHLSTSLAHSTPSRTHLYRIAWLAIQNELHAPTLSTLQACLLMLQRGPTNQYIAATPFKASLLGWTVNVAHILGLNHDCSGWDNLPVWERRVRSRLWWATFSMDCWTSMETNTPPLINADESDVPLLSPPSLDGILATPQHCNHFFHLTTLSNIVHDIHTTFFSIRATASTSQNLTGSLELARGLRGRLSIWKQQYSVDCPLPSARNTRGEPDGNPSLDLAYFAANVLLFRALLRPLSSSNTQDTINEPMSAVLTGAVTCCRDAVQFLETIVEFSSVWNAFWHACSQSNFATVSGFLVQVHMQQSVENQGSCPEMLSLIDRWRKAIRNGAGSGGWGHTLMSLALLKLNGTMSMLSEHQISSSESH